MDDAKKSFGYLLSDLIEKLLSLAGDPGSCALFAAESLRAIIGARTVLVLECSARSLNHRHEAVSVFPDRRRWITEEGAIQEIASQSHSFGSALVFDPGDEGPIPKSLRELHSGPTIVSPLISGPERIGVLILLDLMDVQNVETILGTLNDLSTVLALVLRNAFLYQNLEREVRARTRELEEKNLVLEKALRERELMLKEIHHRVKNNLQIINSLLYLQASTSDDPNVRDALEKGQNRIHSMALVHEELYHSDDLERIDIIGYTEKLCQNLENIDLNEGTTIQVQSNTQVILLPITYSVPIGIILNELITNAIKYAYPPGSGGSIVVTIHQEVDTISISVEDEGIGIPQNQEYHTRKTLGLSLAENLTEQLHGSFRVRNKKRGEKGAQGTLAIIQFPWESMPNG